MRQRFVLPAVVAALTWACPVNPAQSAPVRARDGAALPEIDHLVIGKRIPLHVVRRPGAPGIVLQAMLRLGSSQDPPDRHGLVSTWAALLKRGAGPWSGPDIDEATDAVGADLDVQTDDDRTSIRFSGLAEHLQLGVGLVTAMLTKPTFSEDEFTRERDRRLAAMRGTLDDANAVTELAAAWLHFGDHPYAHSGSGTRRGLTAMTTENVRKFHERHVHPSSVEFVVVGDVDGKALTSTFAKALGPWLEGSGTPVRPALPAYRPRVGRQVLFVPMPVTQAYIRMDLPSVARKHPDHLPLAVMAYILGGSSRGRLYQDIRDRQGLAYGAYASQQPLGTEGRLVLELQTKTSSAVRAIESMLAQMRRMAEKGPTGAELDAAKDYLTGSWGARFEAGTDVAAQVATVRFHGLGDDWFAEYPRRVRSLSTSTLQGVAARYLRTRRYGLTVVAPPGPLEQDLARFGTLQRLEPSVLLD
ncbi:MAG: pitrilysin family protein [Candidatus Sericytochromatia bacterium]|nr:pitrilysin family protein [Candidatus Sericytochromatia bacterium]